MAKGKGGKANKGVAKAKAKAGPQKEPSADDEAPMQVSWASVAVWFLRPSMRCLPSPHAAFHRVAKYLSPYKKVKG